jgi:ribosomal protein L40E
MTIEQSQLRRAAFWDHEVCLSCGAEYENAANECEKDSSAAALICTVCECSTVHDAAWVINLLSLVEREDSDE